MCSLLNWILVAFLVILILIFIVAMFSVSKVSLVPALTYSQIPGVDVEGNNLYNDTLSVAEAQNRCSADASCAGFVTAFGNQNYYKSKMSPTIPPQPDSNSVAYTKQTVCTL